jgi:NitT/TauT family transport system substrate-binding protein
MRPFTPRLAGLLLVLAVGVTGCGPVAAPPTPAPVAAPPPASAAPAAAGVAGAVATPDRVLLAWVRSINGAPLAVATQRGYFEEEGLSIESSEFRSGADVVGALGTGQLDVSSGTISAGTFNAWQRGVKMIVVASQSVYPGEGLIPSNVVVRRELFDSGAVRSAADFRGRKLAINARGGINEVIVARMLARRGLKLDDVDLVTLPFTDHISALANGAIDVTAAPEPFGTLAIDQGVGVRLEEDQRSVGEMQPAHYMISASFAETRADVAVRFLMALMRGARELQGNWVADRQLAKIVEDEIGIKPDLLARMILPNYSPDLATRPEDIEFLQDAFMQSGQLDYSTPLDVRPFVNTALGQRAQAQLAARR